MNFTIGHEIKRLREARGITMEELGGNLYGKSTLSRIESGELQPGRWETEVLLERLGAVTADYLCLCLPGELAEYARRKHLLTLLRTGNGRELRKAWQEAWIALEQDPALCRKKERKSYACQKQFLEYIRLLSYFREGTCIDEVPMSQEERRFAAEEALARTWKDSRNKKNGTEEKGIVARGAGRRTSRRRASGRREEKQWLSAGSSGDWRCLLPIP